MFGTLKKTASAVALSASVALGAISLPATPASATDAEDIAGILAGLAALYVIGRAIEQHNDRPRGSAHVAPPPPPQNHRIAPARCFRDFGHARGYLMRCMQNHVSRPNLLPAQCLIHVNTDRGPRNLYRPRCLAQNGWVREAGFRP